ncbi:Hpt domain-containing protein [Stenotrophomonas sp. CFBP8980]|uniref:Hpt domain-containing protein n=1 Tax=Stenotrophomonas sp. CFBP8980 TaxID=3096523 RepID=UPI002A6B2BEB|nr:Hpt domain-containing protein [Stenotrophomonas sp. CFBP8980]MDY1033525.1 Hpt domain-containing protein [Stenotrophomonas sp. CFBP8980]
MSTLRDAMSHAALGWVKPELDETLRQVRNEVEYFVEAPADATRMRLCAGYLHQVQGTLRMVELYAPAMVAEELEQLAVAIGNGDVAERDESCATLMRGSVLLPDYLERLQNGHRDIPIVLLPLLNEIRAARGMAGINESVLLAFAPDSVGATEAELDHARGSLSGRNRELLDTVGNAVKEELLRIKDALDLHLRTGGAPQQLQQQVNELAAVGDTLAMMGLDVARNVVVQQRDALSSVVAGEQQIDESLLLDVAGALLYVDASLDDQVAHLGATGSGEDDPSAAETRRTLEVLAHEAIANFTVAREHFVAFIETNWNHEQLQDVPRLLGEVGGALRMLDLPVPADYLKGVQLYIDAELIGRQRVPSGRQLDTLADAMASLEYYLEALRDRRAGRESILDITRSSLEALRYWPLPVANAAALIAEPAPQPVQREAVLPPPLEVPGLETLELPPLAAAPAQVPPPLPDFVFDAAPTVQAAQAQGEETVADVADEDVMPPSLEASDGTPLERAAIESTAPTLVFSATTAVPPPVPAWELGSFHAAADENDSRAPTFTDFDPVFAEDAADATRWTVEPVAQVDLTAADDGLLLIDGADFNPVLAEVEAEDSALEPVSFRFDDGDISRADDVLSLEALEASVIEAPAGFDVITAAEPAAFASSEPMQAIEPDAAPAEAAEVDDADARFLAELAAAAADFNPQPEPQAPVLAETPVAAAGTLDGGFDEQAENIDQDIREVFLEEFDEELINIGGLLPAWRAQPDNMDRLRPIRRVFHTLKGSGRLVGARTLGEFAWKIEGMLNRVLDGSRPATPAVVAVVEQAYHALPELNAALRSGQRVSADLQALQSIADRVGAGEETFHVPLPTHPVATAVSGTDEQAGIDALEAAFAADVSAASLEGAPASIDSVLREILEAEVEAHMATLHGWLASSRVEPQPVSDPLLRAVHTMNGAFAMTDVPEITSVTGAAESYIKRSLAAAEVPSHEGVHALDATARAIEATMLALQAESPRVPLQQELADRLQALAATLPEARWPVLEDAGDVLEQAQPEREAVSADADADVEVIDAAEPLAQAEDEVEQIAEAMVDSGELQVIEPEPESVSDEVARVEDRASDEEVARFDAPVVAEVELTGANDLSSFLDPLPVSPVEHERVAEPTFVAETEVPAATSGESDQPTAEPGQDRDVEVQLTGAEDLSLYLDDAAHAALPDSYVPGAIEPVTQYVEPLGQALEATGEEPGEAISDELQGSAAFGETVSLQEALDEGLHVIDDSVEEDAAELISVAGDAGSADEDAAFAAYIDADEPATAPYAEETEQLSAEAEAVDAAGVQQPYFEMEPGAASVAGSSHAGAAEVPEDAHEVALQDAVDASDVEAVEVVEVVEAEVGSADALDFSVLDRELVDIFVEEGKDLLDHCDGLISELRTAPEDREPLAGLQRDLHTLKGGARMAGINPIGDLGHGIESLLEAVFAGRTSIEHSDVQLLERGFDRLHQMLTLTGNHRQVAAADDLVAAFDARTQGRPATPAEADEPAAAAPSAAELIASLPLSAPLPVEAGGEEEGGARPQQEQVRVRADLLDRLVNHAGEVAIYRSRLEQQLGAFRGAMGELDRTNARLRDQLRRLDLETEAQIVARYQREQEQADHSFDPLELDRFSTLQQLSRALNESAADLGGLQGVLDDLSRQYDSLLQQQSRVSSELQDGLMRARMVPFDGLVPRLRRVVRQAGTDTGKQVHLTLEGTHGELDRNVLDRMVAPLEHMLRNSVAHGLETAEQRRAAGKPVEGEISLRLHREGSEIVLDVADDGAGLDREAIRRRALERGLIQADATLADNELDNLIFASGFSTADQLSQLAGRGVGMDVVRNEVRQLGGSVEIHSVRGQGARFTLRLPQTLAVTQAVFVQIGETTFAVPVGSVSGIGRISRERFEAGDSTYRYSGEEYTLHDLGSLIGQAPARAEGQAQVPLLLVRAGDLRAAVAIDQVLGNREIVVKPVGLQIASVPGIYGATITGDGRVVVILDVAPLVRRFVANPERPLPVAELEQQRQVPVVMVVDDSLTMRKVTGRILERHNFEVSVARDGVEALERLEERVPDLMLLDIEMPRMDGYELATAMRADPRYREVPIVMITSRSGDKHRQRAFEIGVQRYLGKPYQELDLMRNVYDLLGIARVRE